MPVTILMNNGHIEFYCPPQEEDMSSRHIEKMDRFAANYAHGVSQFTNRLRRPTMTSALAHVMIGDSRMTYELDPTNEFPDVPPQALMEALGLLPSFLSPEDERTAREQFTANYGFGQLFEFEGSTIDEDGTYHSKYEEPSEDGPGDPPMKPVAKTRLRDETIYIYQYGMVSIVQPDGSAFVTRMD